MELIVKKKVISIKKANSDVKSRGINLKRAKSRKKRGKESYYKFKNGKVQEKREINYKKCKFTETLEEKKLQ